MPTEILQKDGTVIAFGVTGSFSPADAGTQHAAAITDVLTLASLANGAGRQSTKTDLGAIRPTRSRFGSAGVQRRTDPGAAQSFQRRKVMRLG